MAPMERSDDDKRNEAKLKERVIQDTEASDFIIGTGDHTLTER